MTLNTIEKLFTLRTNVLALCDLPSIWRAPLLTCMALLVWCLGIAMIYPPGALVVTFAARNYNVVYKRVARTSEAPTPPTLITYLTMQLNHPLRL